MMEDRRICMRCGHKHSEREKCADHQWTDFCPYEGTECPSEEERNKRIAKLRDAYDKGRKEE